MSFLPFSFKLFRSISCIKQTVVLCLPYSSKPNKILSGYSQSSIWIHTYVKKMSDFILPNNTPFTSLDCQEAFHLLTDKEKLYSHHLSRAYWMGALIVPLQTSSESPLIFSLLHRLFRLQSVNELKKVALEEPCNFTEDDFTAFLVYACGVMANLGNYKAHGDTKIVPNLDKDKFQKLVLLSRFGNLHPLDAKKILSCCLESVYSLQDKEQQLGFPYKGTTTYLSKNFLEEDNEIVIQYLKQKKMEVWNSRLMKTVDESGAACYEIRLASVLSTDDQEDRGLLTAETVNSHKFLIARGDYSKILKLVNENLQLAMNYAANEKEEQMIKNYIKSFHTGSIDAHKDGSRVWVQDKEPIVETYVGFIETYKDPAGVRGEFEGFVAMVNKPMSVKFAALVNLSEELIGLLPWPSAYENDKFLQPDFSSLDVLTFAGGDIPIGINIPNYEQIRKCEGFKNVTLGNVIRMKSVDPPNYLNKADQELFMTHRVDALEVQTGLHELLGHGSGKLFKKEDGNFNFDADQVLNYETNEKVSSWYEEGETYTSVFGSFGSAYEECRAESIGMYLSTVPEILKIFGLEGAQANDVMYVNWIDCVYAGIEALKFYDPKTGSWLQAHGQAAYVMLQVLLECEGNFVTVQKIQGEDGKPDLLFTMDRTKIMSHGKPCMERFLKKLQLYKAIADKGSAEKMFNKYSEVTSESNYPFLDYREIVIARKKPRRLIVQANTFLEDGKVKLKTYEASPEGLIQSYIDRYQGINIDEILEELWEKDKIHFT